MARKAKASENRPQLSRLEMEIMDVVWQLGESSSTKIVEAVQRERDLAPTTIRTVLGNLRKKGYVELVPTVERSHRYKPVVSRNSVARKSLRELLGNLFEGSPREAIIHLIKNERLTTEDLDEIRRLIDEAESREDEA